MIDKSPLTQMWSLRMRMPRTPKPYYSIFPPAKRLREILRSDIGSLPLGRYPHWDNLRFRQRPHGFSHEEWWFAIKTRRMGSRHELPFRDKLGNPFWFADSGYLYRQLHQVDRDASGRIEVDQTPDGVSHNSRERYLINSLIEEAITSSQLEGATTTRRVAKELLRSGRPPRDLSERMIVNNYFAMEFLRENTHDDLTLEMLCEVQRLLTQGTLDDSSAVGRLRKPSESVHIVDLRDGTILHTPPDANKLKSRLDQLFTFANTQDDDQFVHPVIRAILLHFMIGYDHPFVDGNGRTARALFYWSLARSGYWLTEFLSISTIIRKAPAQYGRAYLYCETDESDVTYFIDYNLRVILRSIKSLHLYLKRKTREARDMATVLRDEDLAEILNHRQIALLAHMLKHGDFAYSIQGHRRSHNVSYQTARTDLLRLADLNLVSKRKLRRQLIFRPDPGLKDRLHEIASSLK